MSEHKVIRVRQKVAHTLYEQSYLPEIVRGVWITTRHLLGNLFGKRDSRWLQTVKYPEVKRTDWTLADGSGRRANYAPGYRGQHRLLLREDGSPRCVACYMCSTICPAYCIHIVAEESPSEAIEKRPRAFEIDQLRCIVCGLCVEVCPEDAIRMDSGVMVADRAERAHSLPTYQRAEAVNSKNELLALTGLPDAPPAYGAQNYREGKPPGK
jgi:NADH-quinone oxidoreductase subunit I